MKTLDSIWCVSTIVALGLASGITSVAAQTGADYERGQAIGVGSSQFEAVKDASKRILADSLSLVLGRSATLDEPVRRRLERDIEENFQQARNRYFEAFDYQCEQQQQVTCNVQAAVNMLELRSSVSNVLDQAAANELRVAMTVDKEAITGADISDALAFIHNGLELQLGYDVYFVDTYVPLAELRSDCTSYDAMLERYRARAGNFETTVSKLEAAQATCMDLLDREAVIVVEGLTMNVGEFDARRDEMVGTIKPQIKFLRTDSKRPLPAPLPLEIPKYGRGESPALARADLNNQMYRDVANYIVQQYSEIVLSRKVRGTSDVGKPQTSGLRVTGVTRDDVHGREALNLIEGIASERFGAVELDSATSARDEHVFTFDTGGQRAERFADELRSGLERAGYTAFVDVDRWGGATVAFATSAGPQSPEVVWNDRKAKSAFKVERSGLRTMRQDQSTGVSMSLNVAEVSLRNKKRRPYLVTLVPVWRDDAGVIVESGISEAVRAPINARATRDFQFRAPSRAATSVEIRIECDNSNCEAGDE